MTTGTFFGPYCWRKAAPAFLGTLREAFRESLVGASSDFIRPFQQIGDEHAIPCSIPLDLPHVTYNRRSSIQIDYLARWYNFGHSRYGVAHRKFPKPYCRDVFFKLELLFTGIHRGPP
jgi:hypothetical protein